MKKIKTLYFKSYHKLTHDTIWKLVVDGDWVIEQYYYVTDDPLYATDCWEKMSEISKYKSLKKFLEPSEYSEVEEITEKEAFLEIL